MSAMGASMKSDAVNDVEMVESGDVAFVRCCDAAK